uniref:Disease resistance protein RPM1 n=1 Tax=Aegilops tauschii TaxID=37682 RepID=N1QYX7_AEGTA
MELSKVTVGRCGGIPKVIATIGHLFTKENAAGRRWSVSATDLLKEINDDFMHKLETDQEFHSLRDLFSWMQSYFDGCSDSLKPCIFYLSIFPPEQKLRQRHLLRRWIAEGYCRDTYNATAEENGERLFMELVSLSIIQRCQKTMKCLYQVNGFFHEYIISRRMEDNLVFALEGNCSPNSQHAGQHLTIREDWDRDITVFKTMDFSRLRSLTVFGKWMSFFLSSDMSLLRVLDMADTSGILDADLEQIVKVLPRLKFLSLRGCKGISHLPESFGGLRQLQTLDVRDTSIAMLPLCVIKLQKLQYIRAGTIISSDEGDDALASIPTTTVDQTSRPLESSDDMVTTLPETTEEVQTSTPPEASDDVVTTLPKTTEEIQTSTLPETRTEVQISISPEGSDDMVTALPETTDVQTSTRLSWSCRPCSLVSSWLSKLRRRRLDNDGVEFPVGIGSMTALHTIGVVNVNIPNGKAILKELKNLTQLRKLSVSGINRQNIQELCDFISGHKHLESLSLRLDKDKDKDEGLLACFGDMISQPPKTLKSLKLYGHVNKLPIWIKQLNNLEKLHLELTILVPEDMHFLGGLPDRYCLRGLCVKPIQDGELNFGTLGNVIFSRLRVLEIDCTSKLHVTFVERVFREAEVLKIHCSDGASLRISGLEHMSDLKEVWLKGDVNWRHRPTFRMRNKLFYTYHATGQGRKQMADKVGVVFKMKYDEYKKKCSSLLPHMSIRLNRWAKVMEMIQRGERPDDIQSRRLGDNDMCIYMVTTAPSDDEYRVLLAMGKASQTKFRAGSESSPKQLHRIDVRVRIDSASQAAGSNDKSDHGGLLLTTEPAMGSEAPVDDDATSPKQ